jgi:hypothetical protein
MKLAILTIVDVILTGLLAKALFGNYKAVFKAFFHLTLPVSPFRRKNRFYDPTSFVKVLVIVVVLAGLVVLEQWLFY